MSRLLLPLVLLILAAGHADAHPTPGHLWFRPDARLDTSQVEDRRAWHAEDCLYIPGDGYHCKWVKGNG